MKTTLLLILLMSSLPLVAKDPTSEDYFRAGEDALAKNDLKTAKTYYQAALQLNPQHGNARFRLLSMKDLNAQARVKLRQQRMKDIKLPIVDFEDFTLQESIEALGIMIEQASEETFVPNFVISDPKSSLKDNKVTLRLRNIPASTALTYVLDQAKAKPTWDEHVITIKPAGAAAPKAVEP